MAASDGLKREPEDVERGGQRQPPEWDLFRAYEDGKSRRYALLFSVNGGAYALIGFLAGDARTLVPAPLFLWAFVLVPFGMILFSWKMCEDIATFGTAMRDLDSRPSPQRVFGDAGQSLLRFIRWLFVAGWAAAIIAAAWSFLAAAR